MQIVQLTASNVKRISAVTITPDGNLVAIGGRTAQGKSSVLDAIEFALGGEPKEPMPVRHGEEKATIVVDLGEIVVKRTITATGGGSLVITNADGVKQMSPQAILDKLTGTLTFDPLEFARQKPKQQAETLRTLVGLDFAKEDAARAAAFDDRTAVNREVKGLEARVTALPKHEGLPVIETATTEVLEQQSKAEAQNRLNAEAARQAKEMAKEAQSEASILKTMASTLEETKRQLQRQTEAIERQQTKVNALQADSAMVMAAAGELKDVDVSQFKAKLAEVELVNAKIRANRAREEVVKQYKGKSSEADALTAKIETFDSEKRRRITGAKYPIDGISFDPTGAVTLAGIPFQQSSSAEQLRVSVAIGLALNPKLRVLLIRDGSLLDTDSLKMLGEMAEKADAQVWIERVGTDAQTSVVIEDGKVATT